MEKITRLANVHVVPGWQNSGLKPMEVDVVTKRAGMDRGGYESRACHSRGPREGLLGIEEKERVWQGEPGRLWQRQRRPWKR